MYEHNNIPEPTCEGWWWASMPAWPRSEVREVHRGVGMMSDAFRWSAGSVSGYCLPCPGLSWTGPIPVPEDKPAHITIDDGEHVSHVKLYDGGVGEAVEEKLYADKPATSEKEETLAETVQNLSGGLGATSHRPGSSEFVEDKFAPSEEAELEAIRKDDPDGLHMSAETILRNKKLTWREDRLRDEKLGAFAVNYLHGYLGTAITISLKPEDNAEYGGAIRARVEGKSP